MSVGGVGADTVFLGEAGWEFLCPWQDERTGTCPFVSRGWDTADGAVERGKEHLYEHMEGVPMTDMKEFMIRHGLRDAHWLAGDE